MGQQSLLLRRAQTSRKRQPGTRTGSGTAQASKARVTREAKRATYRLTCLLQSRRPTSSQVAVPPRISRQRILRQKAKITRIREARATVGEIISTTRASENVEKTSD
jgi:hypothetical protein